MIVFERDTYDSTAYLTASCDIVSAYALSPLTPIFSCYTHYYSGLQVNANWYRLPLLSHALVHCHSPACGINCSSCITCWQNVDLLVVTRIQVQAGGTPGTISSNILINVPR
jgi:hypothetical protein